MDWLLELNDVVNEIVWGPPILILIVGSGIFLTVAIGFKSFTKLGYVFKETLGKIFTKGDTGEGEVTPFQAVSTALAATVGTGNIAGVATAITIGGPGAVFWMWVSALFGMATKYAEVLLSVEYREKTEDSRYVGGPMYYIEKGTKWNLKWLAILFAVFGSLAAFGIGNLTQSNSVADVLNTTFNIDPLVSGIVMSIVVALVTIGGIRSIGRVTEWLVPFMAVFYIIGGLFIILINIDLLFPAIRFIFEDAFTGSAAVGGFTGSTFAMAIQYGIARGVFTNEAGLGSAPIAHAAAKTDHPVRQALWGIFEVFGDTLVIATITSLVIVVTGVWNTGIDGAPLTTAAFEQGIPYGGYIVTFGLMLFAFSTILGWSYYGERCIEYLFGQKMTILYRIVFIALIVVGAIGGLTEIWALADTLNGLMIIPNMIAVLILSPVVIRKTKEYFGKGGIYEREKKEKANN